MEFPNLKRGEDYSQPIQMPDGSQRIAYYYCSMRGAFFSCMAKNTTDALEQCESWLLRNDRH